MKIPKIKDIVNRANTVKFWKYRQKIFYYVVQVEWTDVEEDKIYLKLFVFPVPEDDIGDATLWHEDKAIFFMRYIRKALEDGTFVPQV